MTQSFFDCPNCGRRSYNPNDIANEYCGACHTFPDDRKRASDAEGYPVARDIPDQPKPGDPE